MPAFRPKNIRSGDLAEQLGILLFQNLALVAPVPRTEDVGIDAVITLLEDFDARRFKASNSFYVQFKSKSITYIDYAGEEVTWLFALELPFFIAEVDRQNNRIELYCCHALHEAFVTNPYRPRLRVEFKNGIYEDGFAPVEESVKVGPPIMSWSIDDFEQQPDLRAKFNEICKAHIEVFKKSMEYRRIGRVETPVWQENTLPQTGAWKSMDPVAIDIVNHVGNVAVPYLVPYLDLCMRKGDEYQLNEILLLTQKCRLIVYMEKARQMHPPGTPIPIPEEFQFIEDRRKEDEKIIVELLRNLNNEGHEMK